MTFNILFSLFCDSGSYSACQLYVHTPSLPPPPLPLPHPRLPP